MAATVLTVRKLADTSAGTRVNRYDQITGEKVLVNPDTGAVEPWPLAGVEIVGEVPEQTSVPTGWVAKAKAEGWVTVEGETVVHRPGGSPDNLWGTTHTFLHADSITIHTVDGDVKYNVVHQPDKYVEDGSDDDEVTDEIYQAGETRVDWFYGLELAS
jgi:hypothetical protein